MKKFTFEGTLPHELCNNMPSFNNLRTAIDAAYKEIKFYLNHTNKRFEHGDTSINEYVIVYIGSSAPFSRMKIGFGPLNERNIGSRSYIDKSDLLEQANKDTMFNEQCEAEHERRLSLNFVLLHGEPQPDGSIQFSVISMKDLAE